MTGSGQPLPSWDGPGQGVLAGREHHAWLIDNCPSGLDVVGFESDDVLTREPRAWAALQRTREQLPVALYSPGLGLGDEQPPQAAHLERVADLVEHIQPAWVSEPLCWTSHLGHYSHARLPLPRTLSVSRQVADHVRRVQDRLRRRISIENVASYVDFADSEMSEVEFLSEVARLADCWIALDLTALHLSSKNHGFDAMEFLRRLPGGRVRQLYLCGHDRDEQPGEPSLLVDSRTGPVCEAVWQLYRSAERELSAPFTSLEWRGAARFESLLDELGRARAEREAAAAESGPERAARSAAGGAGVGGGRA